MEVELSQEAIDKLLQGITLPSPPQIIADLQMALIDPDIGAAAQIICTDPGLAGGVLKAANSSAFGCGRSLTSVKEAAMMLGLDVVNSIVNTLCLRHEMSDEDGDEALVMFMSLFWDSCSDTATLASMVAKKTGVTSLLDEAYMLGLFHNVGVLLLLKRFPGYIDVLKASYEQKDVRIVDIENQHFNTNHAVLGYFTAKSWHLSVSVTQAIAKHHSAIELLSQAHEDYKVKSLVAILKVAEHISGFHRVIAEQEEDYEWAMVGEYAMDYLGMTQDDLEDVVAAAAESGIGSGKLYY